MFFKFIDTYKGYRDDYYVYELLDEGFTKMMNTKSKKEAYQEKKDNDNIVVEQGRLSYKNYDTAMDYLETEIDIAEKQKAKYEKRIAFADIFVPCDDLEGGIYYPKIQKIEDMAYRYREKTNRLFMNKDIDMGYKLETAGELKAEFVEKINGMKFNDKTLRYLIEAIEKKKFSHCSSYLFKLLFDLKCDVFYELICKSKEPIYEFVEDENGEYDIMGFKYTKKLCSVDKK